MPDAKSNQNTCAPATAQNVWTNVYLLVSMDYGHIKFLFPLLTGEKRLTYIIFAKCHFISKPKWNALSKGEQLL
jgi:hypothetical protein